MSMTQLIILCLIYATQLQANNSPSVQVMEMKEQSNKVQKYSFPPNNTPISKVYVLGRPVYVRQPFVIPQRDVSQPKYDNHVMRDERFHRGTVHEGEEAVEHTFVQESVLNQFFTENDPLRYELPERPFPNTDSYNTYNPPTTTPEPKAKYPLPQCYTNDSGFMCCNPKLEQVMKDVYDELSSDPKWQSCNVQKIANTLQNRTQSIFNTDFEALAGLGDFASKTHFYSDLICKIEMQGRFMLSYATPNRHHVVRPEAYSVQVEASSIGYL